MNRRLHNCERFWIGTLPRKFTRRSKFWFFQKIDTL